MASKKDKLLENAQRFVLKGQIDKAIKEYQQIVALDPREIRFRQRLAELLVRDNRKEEAIAEYEDIGKHYAENSYFLKAIAVYKQIQRLDSSNPAISHTLAILNQKQGLAGNALAEYNSTVRLLEQQGDLPKAVAVVQEMLALDADNVATQLKHAELLYATGQKDPSYAAFAALFKRLVHSDDEAAAVKVSSRIAELFPGKDEHELELLSLRVQKGDLDGALAALRQALRHNEGNQRAWQLLCEVLRRKGEKGEVRSALDRMAQLFPNDLGIARDSIRSCLEAGAYERGIQLLSQHAERFLAEGKGRELEALYLALPAALRGEPQVEEGLRRVYEASGDWEKLNALRAPVLQNAATSPAATVATPAAAPPPAVEHSSAWEEEIDLDFEEHIEESDAEPGDSLPAAHGSMELEWPEESEPFLTQEPDLTQEFHAEPADLPWGEVATEEAAEAAPEKGGADEDALDFFAGHGAGEAPEFELSLEDPAAEGEKSLELELPDDALASFLEPAEDEPRADAAPVAEEPVERVTWDDIFPGCIEAEDNVDLEDAESHYDLGIAYMEMGRPDAALQEFATAAANPRRRVDCLILQGMSHRSKGDDEKAEDLLKKGLLVRDLSPQEQMTLRYELASLYEGRGATLPAIALYREIKAADPTFRDVAQKLSLLVGEEPHDIIDLELEEVL
ncbi:tetratricopeptide repeat protein [Geomonas sp. RF6]|uniref:tetratricopeptide repeat protein n=1 Tax=Geomonas sp. RF6 TaxID=2897342 RepID=UPI001E54EE42|nr:tetratricopeptide repeat protein [Geomonas sp. RF6]UFS70826.1 tetratricopeptide repeat protein [Geomonas sp. RF6]